MIPDWKIKKDFATLNGQVSRIYLALGAGNMERAAFRLRQFYRDGQDAFAAIAQIRHQGQIMQQEIADLQDQVAALSEAVSTVVSAGSVELPSIGMTAQGGPA